LVTAAMGISTIALSSVIYFTTKKEHDERINRLLQLSNKLNEEEERHNATATGSSSSCTAIETLTTRLFSMATVQTWMAIHKRTQLLFMTVVLGGTLMEVWAYALGQLEEYFFMVPLLDHFLALPSLGLATFSGVAVTHSRYIVASQSKNKQCIPSTIHTVMILLQGFGVYWAIADKITQSMSVRYNPNAIFWTRLMINFGACGISIYIWYIMRQFASRHRVVIAKRAA
jgi:hypothetical protein